MKSVDVRPEWQCLVTPGEIEGLMQLFGGFHDACLREIHLETGHYVEENLSMRVDWRTTVLMLFQRQFRDPSVIELRFEEVIGLHVSPPLPNCESIIFAAAFFVRDGVYYWAENGNWAPEHARHPDATWVAARKVYWREASGWLGPSLRYNTGVE